MKGTLPCSLKENYCRFSGKIMGKINKEEKSSFRRKQVTFGEQKFSLKETEKIFNKILILLKYILNQIKIY